MEGFEHGSFPAHAFAATTSKYLVAMIACLCWQTSAYEQICPPVSEEYELPVAQDVYSRRANVHLLVWPNG